MCGGLVLSISDTCRDKFLLMIILGLESIYANVRISSRIRVRFMVMERARAKLGIN